MFIVQFNVAATARERPISPPSAWRIPPVEDTIESVADDLLERRNGTAELFKIIAHES